MYYIRSAFTAFRTTRSGLILVNWINGDMMLLTDAAAAMWKNLETATHARQLYADLSKPQAATITPELLSLGLGRLEASGFVVSDSCLEKVYQKSRVRPRSRGVDADVLMGNIFTTFSHVLNEVHPIKVDLELNMSCNLRCRHCYINDYRDRNLLSESEYRSLLQELRREGVLFLSLTGGEVTLRKSFIHRLRQAREEGFIVTVLTNGTHIGERELQEVAYHLPANVHISLYGVDAATHDYVTRSTGAFNKTMLTVRALRRLGVPVVLRFVLMHHNSSALPRLPDFAEDLDCLYTVNPVVFSLGRDMVSKKTMEAKDMDIIALFRQGDLPPPTRAKCIAGQYRIRIASNGDIFPCEMLRVSLGNVRHISIARALASPIAESIRSNTPMTPITPCQNCESRSFCPRCPGLAFHEDGDLSGGSSTACRVSKLYKQACVRGV